MAAWQIAGLPAWEIAQSREPADALVADAVCRRIDERVTTVAGG